MKKVIEILEQIKQTASTKDKINILNENKQDITLQHVFYYTYNPYLRYGISEQKLSKMTFEPTNNTCKDIWTMLDELSKNNINDSLRNEIRDTISQYSDDEKELIKSILIKDLRIGVNTSTINKVWKKLIPTFKVQLANNYRDVKLNDNEHIFITEKLDGVRCICIKNGNNISFFSRQGKPIDGLLDIQNTIKDIPGDFVLDGELIVSDNSIDSGEQYKQTMKIVRTLNPYKKGITYNVFDILTIFDFQNGVSDKTYVERRKILDDFISNYENNELKVVPLIYSGTDHLKIQTLLDVMTETGREGIMINRDDFYKCNRNNSILKCKKMDTCDLCVIAVEEGVGKNSNRLGNIVCMYKGFELRVGSGFTDEQRDFYWQNQDSIIGKIVEISYFEETNNEQGGLSLRFPVFKHIREDKDIPSYN